MFITKNSLVPTPSTRDASELAQQEITEPQQSSRRRPLENRSLQGWYETKSGTKRKSSVCFSSWPKQVTFSLGSTQSAEHGV